MSLNTPNQIDLSRDIKDQNTRLSPEQQESFQSYLEGLREDEREQIIYLTQEELQELKNIISEEVDQQHQADFDEFIEAQQEEGLSLEDAVSGVEGISEELIGMLQGVETYAQESLFGDEGIFGSLDISDTAQNHMSMALLSSIFETLSPQLIEKIEDGELSNEDMQEIAELATDMQEKFEEVRGAFMVDGTEGTSIVIHERGEGNSVFMNTNEAREFFNTLILGNMSPEEARERVESANVAPGTEIPTNIQDLYENIAGPIESISTAMGELTTEQQQDILATLIHGQIEEAAQGQIEDTVQEEGGNGSPGNNAAPGGNGPNANPDASPEEQQTWLEELREKKPFGAILAAILEAIRGFIPDEFVEGDSTSNDGGNDNPEEAPEEIAPTRVETLRSSLISRLSEGAFANISETALQNFFSTEGNMERFLTVLQEIPSLDGQDTLEERIENLLFTNIASENTPKLLAFIEAGGLGEISDEDGAFNSENFMLAVTAYKNYRLTHSEDTTLTYQEFFDNNNE